MLLLRTLQWSALGEMNWIKKKKKKERKKKKQEKKKRIKSAIFFIVEKTLYCKSVHLQLIKNNEIAWTNYNMVFY